MINRPIQTDELYRLLIESVRDYAIFALDSEGYILSWNPGAERFNGYAAEEIIGQHFSVFYTQEARDSKHPQYELAVAAEEGRYEEEGWRIRKDGSHFWASVVITALRDANGVLQGYAKVTRDLTERREAHLRAVEDARRVAEAEAANRAKAEFLAMLSHELRTPLNAIGGYVDLILLGLRGEITEETRADLERVRRSQNHLLGLINDLLNLSRAEAGGLTYDIHPFGCAEVLDSVAALLMPEIYTRGLELNVAPVAPDLHALGDRSKVEQVLLNILTNALKFTEAGGHITISAEARDATVEIAVSDTGVGIPAEQLEHVFEPFVQLGRSFTSAHEGIGLGLAISRELARAMGGDLRAASEPGAGSTFTLILPLAPSADA